MTDHASTAVTARRAAFEESGFPELPETQIPPCTRLRSAADRALGRDLAEVLRGIADLAAGGHLPRWLILVLAPSVAMLAHCVRDFMRRQEVVRRPGRGPTNPTSGTAEHDPQRRGSGRSLARTKD